MPKDVSILDEIGAKNFSMFMSNCTIWVEGISDKIYISKYLELYFKENGVEFWYARELQKVLDYKDWRKFENVIKKAMQSCESTGNKVNDWVVNVDKPIITGKGKKELIKDYKLTRYICYLIAQNGDPRKEKIAQAQTYFAVQTR